MLDITKYNHIHCIGIGGIGLSAVAEIFCSRGYTVSGSDMKLSDTTAHLASRGIRIFEGHDAGNIAGADLIVYSSAISRENPELLAAREAGIPAVTRAEALGALMHDYSTSIAVSGTHGKTTTTSMVSLILDNAKKDPTILVGGNLNEFHGNVKIGKSDLFVTEACEYMDSFLSLRPKIEIILNIDSIIWIISRISIISSLPLTGLRSSFPKTDTSSPTKQSFVSRVIADADCHVITFGFSENADFYAANIEFNSEGHPLFDVCSKGQTLGRVQLEFRVSITSATL